MYIYLYMNMCIYLFVNMLKYLCMYVYLCVYAYVYKNVKCMHIHIYVLLSSTYFQSVRCVI